MTHRHAPRPFSGCCRARMAGLVCSECGQPSPWRKRLTEEEAERVTARLTRPVVVVSPEQQRRGLAALYEEAYD